jgi:2-dehydro-3-deoxyphosphogluconate aldolase/(4S)-4-hydroxy-2-oxoglutarate aldolase
LSAIERIAACGIVPVVRIERADDGPELARTLSAAGIGCIEITFRSDAAADAIRAIRCAVPEVLVGAGTIVSEAQLIVALAAGAMFIVSPGLQVDVVRACLDRGCPVLPGVFTPTEVIQAMDLGLSTVKLFPASVAGGPAYLRALAGPFPTMRFVPTGGIELADLAAYLDVPSVLAVGGSWMVRPALLAGRDWPAVGRLASEASSVVRSARPPVA